MIGMIPGMGKAMKGIEMDDNAFKSVEAMIGSMTPYERANPDCMNYGRKMRIAKGSGNSLEEVNRIMKQFDQMRKMMKMMTGSKMGKNMRQSSPMPRPTSSIPASAARDSRSGQRPRASLTH